MSFCSVIIYSHHGVNKVKISCHYSFRLVDGFQCGSSVAVWVIAYQCKNSWNTTRHYCSARV